LFSDQFGNRLGPRTLKDGRASMSPVSATSGRRPCSHHARASDEKRPSPSGRVPPPRCVMGTTIHLRERMHHRAARGAMAVRAFHPSRPSSPTTARDLRSLHHGTRVKRRGAVRPNSTPRCPTNVRGSPAKRRAIYRARNVDGSRRFGRCNRLLGRTHAQPTK
jgi:hypothetical protein